jgi:hypothetical protein|tara:strand:- start:344 stop:520 length:177 start_codon:yes stop_codon:yes gene_type:complete
VGSVATSAPELDVMIISKAPLGSSSCVVVDTVIAVLCVALGIITPVKTVAIIKKDYED